jgi:hypothetical protein
MVLLAQQPSPILQRAKSASALPPYDDTGQCYPYINIINHGGRLSITLLKNIFHTHPQAFYHANAFLATVFFTKIV